MDEKDLLITRNNLEMATQESRQSAFQEQLRSTLITAEARLETLLQHWNLEHKLTFLQRKEVLLTNVQSKSTVLSWDPKNQKPVVLRKRRRQVKASANWKMFCYQFAKDHAKADLIWNEKTRDEFRQSIENELRTLQQEMDLVPKGVTVSWNHTEFQVLIDIRVCEASHSTFRSTTCRWRKRSRSVTTTCDSSSTRTTRRRRPFTTRKWRR